MSSLVHMLQKILRPGALLLLLGVAPASVLAVDADSAAADAQISAGVVVDGTTIFDDVVYDGASSADAPSAEVPPADAPAVDVPSSAVPSSEVPPAADAAEPVMDAATALEISQQISRFEDKIVALESEFGPYDVSLIEALMDMGRYQAGIAQYQSAAEMFDRALSITRISNGLFSEQQLPVLQELSAAYQAAAEWQKADDREYLAYSLKSRLYVPGSEAYAAAVIGFGDWKMYVLRENLLQQSPPGNLRDLEQLRELYRQALEKIQPSADQPVELAAGAVGEPMSRQTHFTLLHSKALAEYQLADYALRSVPYYMNRPVEPYISEFVCNEVVTANGQVARTCGTVRRENPLYREYQMQQQLYRDRIRTAVMALEGSIQQMNMLLDQDSRLMAADDTPARDKVEELARLYNNVDRAYRRSAMLW